ncbi:MAG: calcium-binding protein [Nostoc sp.]|uniref:calcium-binding protein n=1 Tax=Nostoc sp. TaxID=1180 RepID=UPI002FF2AFCE
MPIIIGTDKDDIINAGLGTYTNYTVNGGLGNDTINVGNGNNTVDGGDGNDLINSGFTKGSLIVGSGSDTINGGLGNDTINAGNGNNLVDGGDGNDVVIAGIDNDTLIGGTGDDFLRGARGQDLVIGNDGNDTLIGGIGNDTLIGGAGDDDLIGEKGKDILTGGPGNDTFFVKVIYESPSVFSGDVITDFVGNGDLPGDQINLYTIDANSTIPGNQAFTFIGAAPFSAPGQVRYSNGVLQATTNENLTTNIGITLQGAPQLVASDIIL